MINSLLDRLSALPESAKNALAYMLCLAMLILIAIVGRS